MGYTRLKVTDHIDRWTVDKLRHVENGILANEAALENKQEKGNYVTVTEALAILEDYQPRGDYALASAIPNVSDFITKTQTETILSSYALKKDIPSIGHLVDKNTLKDYALKEEVNDSVSTIVNEALQEYALISEVQDLFTDLNAEIAQDYMSRKDMPRMEDYVKVEALDDYALISNLPDVTVYATKDSLNDYVLKETIPAPETLVTNEILLQQIQSLLEFIDTKTRVQVITWEDED